MKSETIEAAAGFLLFVVILTSCVKERPAGIEEPKFTESILDRKEHVEPDLVLDVPEVPRWCGRLNLKYHRIDVGDGNCSLYVEEEGNGIPLVLINGGPGGTHHYFHPWFSRAAKWARVIYYDQRGTGLSDYEPGKKGYTVEQAVQDLDKLRKALNVGKWVVLGYSYGGFLAQYYALHFPEHTAGMVLLNASPGMAVGRDDSRIHEFLTDRERARLREISEEAEKFREELKWDPDKAMQVLIYNNALNGDWKLQHFHKPTPERASQMALYEWVHDAGFNGIIGNSMSYIDLTGAFENCPIPTLICEGAWDMTWNTEKARIIQKNHPRSRLVIFENSAHQLYEDEPDRFFDELKKFMAGLKDVSEEALGVFRADTEQWLSSLASSPEYVLGAYGWSRSSSEKLAREYSREWLAGILPNMISSDYLKVGFALYDTKVYSEALFVFEKLEDWGHGQNNQDVIGLSKIWQGHMLDLVGAREKAKDLYAEVAAMKVDAEMSHGQYGMKYRLSVYAEERLRSPFQRVENRILD